MLYSLGFARSPLLCVVLGEITQKLHFVQHKVQLLHMSKPAQQGVCSYQAVKRCCCPDAIVSNFNGRNVGLDFRTNLY